MKALRSGRLILVVAQMLLLGTAPALSGGRADLVYEAYYAGLNMARLDLQLDLGSASYEVRSRLRMLGIVNRLWPWEMSAYAKGLRHGSRIEPLTSGQWNNWGGKERFIDMRFMNGIPQVVRIKPDSKTDDRPTVPAKERLGSMDAMGAILTLLTHLDGKEECEARIPVFDGRRRYNLIAEADGSERLESNARSPFSGPAIRCILWMEKKGGFKERTDDRKDRYDRRARVWMGRISDGIPPVPVRMTYESRFGVVNGYLAEAVMETGGVRQSLRSRSTSRWEETKR